MMIRRLGTHDVEAFVRVRRAALLDTPLAFAASPEDDIASSPDTIRDNLGAAPDYAIFGAFDLRLVGVLGVMRDRHIKAAHKAHFVGMYVDPTHRRRGTGAALLQAAISHASRLPGITCVHLSVSDATPAARRLYERAGFEVWGSEPDALRYSGESHIEHHMWLRLK
jgi:RimJ/RimL family protein N-acetyltransferase